jgi:hypothetical protein
LKEKKVSPSWPPPLGIDRSHVILYVAGLVVCVIGYLLMSVGPWDNPISRSVAPLVLLLAYLVIFPMAILKKSDKK